VLGDSCSPQRQIPGLSSTLHHLLLILTLLSEPFDARIKSLQATLPARIFLLGILNFNAYF